MKRLPIIAVFALSLPWTLPGQVPFRTTQAVGWRTTPSGPPSESLPAGTRVELAESPELSAAYVRATRGTAAGWIPVDSIQLDLNAPEFEREVSAARNNAQQGPRLLGVDTILVRRPGGMQAMHTEFIPYFEITKSALGAPVGGCPIAVPNAKNFRDGSNWMLTDQLECALPQGAKLVVPRGFVTDFASVPFYLRWLVGPTGTYGWAAVIHDFLYWDQTCSKKESDKLFKLAMGASAVQSKFRTGLYLAVVLFGRSAYNDNAADRKNGNIRVVGPPDDDVLPGVEWSAMRARLRKAGKKEPPYSHPDASTCAL